MKSILLFASLLFFIGCAPLPQPREEVQKEDTEDIPHVCKQVERALSTSPGSISEVLVEQVFEFKTTDRIFLIDTRPSLFYGLGHIDGAESIPLKKFDKVFPTKEELIKNAAKSGKVVVIYCANEKCPDSYTMAVRLAEMGIDVCIFKGGWELWKQSGLADM